MLANVLCFQKIETVVLAIPAAHHGNLQERTSSEDLFTNNQMKQNWCCSFMCTSQFSAKWLSEGNHLSIIFPCKRLMHSHLVTLGHSETDLALLYYFTQRPPNGAYGMKAWRLLHSGSWGMPTVWKQLIVLDILRTPKEIKFWTPHFLVVYPVSNGP